MLRRAAVREIASRAEGGEAAAERAHHPADMLADDIVADADLAQARVHIVDEQLGEQDRRAPPRLAERFQPQQDQSGHRRDHVEAAVDRVRHPPSRYQTGSRPAATIAA